jgi:radical SAM protein with 4Fe4S-binding SPASM domain
MVELKSDIFIIPTFNDISIIYSPLRGAAFYANSEATSIVREYLESGNISEESKGTTVYDYLHKLSQIEVEEPKKEEIHSNSSNAMFILSQICNLECSYCYAQNSRSKEVLSIEKLKAVVDSVCANTDKKNKTFSFIGGGEPLVTWDVFEWSVNYIKKTTEKSGFSRRITLTTNGTLLNEERILFLKENRIQLSVSFDILPDVQNDQRPFPNKKTSSFERVHNNIKMLLSNGLVPRIRSTITNRNVKLMPQMVEFVIKYYPEIKFLHFEPVTDINENSDDFYKAYIASFMEAKQISKEHGVYLKNSITHSFKRIRTRFCNGELCITPSSDIVSCHRISSDREKCFESFKYGKVTNDIEIDTKSLNHVLEIFEEKSKHCSNCFAKWHCAGGCPMYRTISTEKEQLSYCTFVKDTLTSILDERLGR